MLFKRKGLSLSIASVVAITSAPSMVYAAALEEIVVTATKRSETAQSVPVAVTALGGESLEELNVTNFDDYVQYLPNVTIQGRGPGQSEIYIRGATAEQAPIFISETNGSAPSVALYQDEQPVSFGGRNLDIYTTDLERVEVLAGPQGTLFGANSQAGTIRLITNKPQINEFDAGFDTSFSNTSGGETSNSVEAFLNIPLIDDKLAIRVAAYNDNKGGYIDNVLGTTTHVIENINEASPIYGGYIPQGATVQTASNTDFVEDDFNDASYSGIRIGAKYIVNDDWEVLLQHTNQTLETEGVFDYDPTLGDLQVERFYNDELDDSFGLTNWTVNGRIGALDLVYTGAYLDREVDSSIDYTGYVNGASAYVAFYACNGDYNNQAQLQAILNSGNQSAIDGVRLATECFDPTNGFESHIGNSRQTHEFRVSSDPDQRFRYTSGIFFDNTETIARGDFIFPSEIELGFAENAPRREGPQNVAFTNGPEGTVLAGVTDPTSRAPGAGFVNDYTREESQIAIFGEVSFDLSDSFSLTLGARYFDIDTTLSGSNAGAYSGKPGIGPGTDSSGNAVDTGGFETVAIGSDFSTLTGPNGETFGFGNGDLRAPGVDSNNGNPGTSSISCNLAGGSFSRGTGLCTINGEAIDPVTLGIPEVNESGAIYKATLSWKPSDGKLFYATYSQGFRPPSLNRGAGTAATNPAINFVVPAIIQSDELDNYELGWKTTWLDGTLRWNASVFFAEFTGIQTSRFDPSNVGLLVFLDNAADAEITGIDSDFQWAATDNLTITGAFSLISTELTDTFGGLGEIVAPPGSDLPFTPNFSGNIRARYEWTQGANDLYAQMGIKYRGQSYSALVADAPELARRRNNVINATRGVGATQIEDVFEIELNGTTSPTGDPAGRFIQQDYFVMDAAVGVKRDAWIAELYVENLTDERAQQSISNIDDVPRFNINRPRTIGLRFSYDF